MQHNRLLTLRLEDLRSGALAGRRTEELLRELRIQMAREREKSAERDREVHVLAPN